MAAGQDRAFRVFSVIQDQQSREVSQGHIAHKAKRMRLAQQDLKLPRVVGMDACQVKHYSAAEVLFDSHQSCACLC